MVGEVEGLAFYEAGNSAGGALFIKGIVDPGFSEQALRAGVLELGFSSFTFEAVERLALGPSAKLRLTGEDDRNALVRR